MVHTKPSSI